MKFLKAGGLAKGNGHRGAVTKGIRIYDLAGYMPGRKAAGYFLALIFNIRFLTKLFTSSLV